MALGIHGPMAPLSLEGQVVDDNGKGIPHYSVMMAAFYGQSPFSATVVKGPRVFVTTDEEGRFKISSGAVKSTGFFVIPRRFVTQDGHWYSPYPQLAIFKWAWPSRWYSYHLWGQSKNEAPWDEGRKLTLSCSKLVPPGPFFERGFWHKVFIREEEATHTIVYENPPLTNSWSDGTLQWLRLETRAFATKEMRNLAGGNPVHEDVVLPRLTASLIPDDAWVAYYDESEGRVIVEMTLREMEGLVGCQLSLSNNAGVSVGEDQSPLDSQTVSSAKPGVLRAAVKEDWFGDCWVMIQLRKTDGDCIPAYYFVQGLDAPPTHNQEPLNLVRALPSPPSETQK